MSYRDFSIAQKLGLAAIVMGCVACIVGAAVPYWVLFNLTDAGVSSSVAEANLGLWMYCGHLSDLSACRLIAWSDIGDSLFHVVRVAASLCVILAAIGSLIALCMACCCKGSTTVCVGITSFVAGGCGAAAMGIFISKVTGLVSFRIAHIQVAHYGWGLIVFGIGFSILLLASFVACFATPKNPPSGYIIGASPTTVVAQTTNNTATAFPKQTTAQPLHVPSSPQNYQYMPQTTNYATPTCQ